MPSPGLGEAVGLGRLPTRSPLGDHSPGGSRPGPGLQIGALMSTKDVNGSTEEAGYQTSTVVKQGFQLILFFFFSSHTYGIWKFLGQGCNLCRSRSNPGSLTPVPQRELPS